MPEVPTMNVKLANLCARLWLFGFAGMWVSKGLFDRGPGAMSFEIAARLCLVGGLTYCLLGLLYVASPVEARPRR
jgi:hypothetical protein